MPTAYFRSVSGLSVEIEVVEFREGGSNDVHKIPGRVKYPNLVLKEGFTGASELQKWALQLTNAWPAKWEGPELDASKNEIAIETIEIAHEGWSLSTDP